MFTTYKGRGTSKAVRVVVFATHRKVWEDALVEMVMRNRRQTREVFPMPEPVHDVLRLHLTRADALAANNSIAIVVGLFHLNRELWFVVLIFSYDFLLLDSWLPFDFRPTATSLETFFCDFKENSCF